MGKIIINHGTFKLGEYELERGTLSVGRSVDNDIQIDDPSVSSHHAKIVTLFETSFVEDLNSTNGTFVNGKSVKKHTLRSSDIVTMGKHQILYHATVPHDVDDGEDHTMILDTSQTAVASKSRPGQQTKQRATPPRQSELAFRSTGASNPAIEKHQRTRVKPAPKITSIPKPDVDLATYNQNLQPPKNTTNPTANNSVNYVPEPQQQTDAATLDVPPSQEATHLAADAIGEAELHIPPNDFPQEELASKPLEKHLDNRQAQQRAQKLWDNREKSSPLTKEAILKQIIQKDNEYSSGLFSSNWFRILAGFVVVLLVLTLFVANR